MRFFIFTDTDLDRLLDAAIEYGRSEQVVGSWYTWQERCTENPGIPVKPADVTDDKDFRLAKRWAVVEKNIERSRN